MESSVSSPVVQDVVELFGSFHLADTELALSVADLQEVVNYPAKVTQIPLAPTYLLGLFNLRGTLIPIVHLSALLQLPDRAARDTAKIAVVELGCARVGLLFDATGEILRVRDEQKISFVHSDGATPMIGGALKLAGGDRILQILSPGALVKLQDVPQLGAQQSASALRRHGGIQGRRRQSVSFRVGEQCLALPMTAIHEIIRLPALQNSVLGSEYCLGLLNLRGHTVPVVDFARFLGLPVPPAVVGVPAEMEDERRIIVVKQNDVYFGFLVDEVQSIVSFHDEDLLAIPSFNQTRPSLFAGCISAAGEQNIILLNHDALFTDAIVTELVSGHRALYEGVSSQDGVTQARRSRGRETFVTFRLGRLMGVRIDQLREVIDFPQDITIPPGMPSFVRGLFTLRQRLVTIVDLRTLYGMAPCEDVTHSKVLLVEHESEQYGLIVDAIENIITIDACDKITVPRVLLHQMDPALRQDLKEVVELADRCTLMLLDTAPLKARLNGELPH